MEQKKYTVYTNKIKYICKDKHFNHLNMHYILNKIVFNFFNLFEYKHIQYSKL